MDAKFQSSFIPKSTSVSSSGSLSPKKSGSGVIGALAGILFVLCGVGIAGAFAYKKVVQNSISGLEGELAAAEAATDKDTIDKLVDFDLRVKSIRQILNSHVASSAYLNLLEDNTVRNISFSSLQYSAKDPSKPIEVILLGSAPSYGAIAEEEAVLLKNPDVLSATFSTFSLGKSGSVNFTLTAKFKTDLIKWSNIVTPIVPAVPASSSVATSTPASKPVAAEKVEEVEDEIPTF